MKNLVIGTLFILTSLTRLSAQEQKDVLLRAMQDEIDRSMKELRLPDAKGPLFIMFGVQDQKSYTIAATLGSIINSNETPLRFKSTTRVLVGDYEFNDESVDDNTFSSPTAWEIGLPIDDDYEGIRRSFWSSTDNVYRSAARHFKRNEQYLKESGKTLEELPHRSFAKSEAVSIIKEENPAEFDKAAWEEKARRLSSLFLKHPSITNSAVIVANTSGYKYLVSSEGTVAKIPFQTASLMVIGQSKSEEGEFAVDQISYQHLSADQFPTEEQMIMDIEAMIKRIENASTLQKLKEEYTGPVLLMGRAVADMLSNTMVRGRESIMANDQIRKLTGYQFDDELNSMDGKIGKQIMNEAITVKAKPTLKSFNGVDLLGSFEIDDEGIVPDDEVIVVENGILKTLLNNRSLTNAKQVANGFSNGPGVLEISLKQKDTEKALKEKLIAEARKQGLEFGIMVGAESSFGYGFMNVYKVYVKDGREELVKHASISPASMKDLRHLVGASADYTAYNLGGGNPFGMGGMQGGANSLSIIVPKAILMDELEVRPYRMPTLKEEEYVTSPLAGGE